VKSNGWFGANIAVIHHFTRLDHISLIGPGAKAIPVKMHLFFCLLSIPFANLLLRTFLLAQP